MVVEYKKFGGKKTEKGGRERGKTNKYEDCHPESQGDGGQPFSESINEDFFFWCSCSRLGALPGTRMLEQREIWQVGWAIKPAENSSQFAVRSLNI